MAKEDGNTKYKDDIRKKSPRLEHRTEDLIKVAYIIAVLYDKLRHSSYHNFQQSLTSSIRHS